MTSPADAGPLWWPRIAPEARLRLAERLPSRIAYCPYVPTVKQAAFLMLDQLEAFYGGAAGPGKSTALLMAALQHVDDSSYAALLLRRTYADLSLPGALMDVAAEWLADTDAKWSDAEKTWTFPSGATLTFGYLENEKDKYRYASAEFQYIGFDELTQFGETQYRFLFSRLRRRAGSRVPLRMRSASNPGGPGHGWVKRRFVSATTKTPGAVFIPATIHENPGLDVSEYLRSLAHLPKIERDQLIRGDWESSVLGEVFRRQWWKPLPTLPPFTTDAVRGWDFAATEPSPENPDPDWTVGALWKRLPDGSALLHEIRRTRVTAGRVEAYVREAIRDDDVGTRVALPQDPGAGGKITAEGMRQRLGYLAAIELVPITSDKVAMARPLAVAAENGLVFVTPGHWLEEFLDEADDFTGHQAGHDDQVDAAALGFRCLPDSGDRVDLAAHGVSRSDAPESILSAKW